MSYSNHPCFRKLWLAVAVVFKKPCIKQGITMMHMSPVRKAYNHHNQGLPVKTYMFYKGNPSKPTSYKSGEITPINGLINKLASRGYFTLLIGVKFHPIYNWFLGPPCRLNLLSCTMKIYQWIFQVPVKGGR